MTTQFENLETKKANELKCILRNIGGKLTHSNKRQMIDEIEKMTWYSSFPWREEQKSIIDAFGSNKYKNIIVNGTFGSGKCFEKDTPILMFDGTVKKIQDIVVGDIVMGDDSTERKILSLARGTDDMYEITNKNGDSYTVNKEHVLCLKYSIKKNMRDHSHLKKRFTISWFDGVNVRVRCKSIPYTKENKTQKMIEAQKFLESIDEKRYCEITVKEYLKLNKTLQRDLKGYTKGVEFSDKDVDIDPYLLGLWLGDSNDNDSNITNQDSAVIKYLKEYLPSIDGDLQHGYRNVFNTFLRENNLLNNKHVPHSFKCNSREKRMSLLAGFIDSDGYKSGENSLGFTQGEKHERLFDDMIFLCKSLGFTCNKRVINVNYNYNGLVSVKKQYRTEVNGNGLADIPILCQRKKIQNERPQMKDSNVFKINVGYKGVDKYYGFMTDKNQRFLLANFNVTHNSTLLIGLIFKGVCEGRFKANEIMFTAFNLCVKNELRKKITKHGIRGKIDVRTFDSIIFRLCKIYGKSDLDFPNFEGRRKFIYKVISEIKNGERERAEDFDEFKFVLVDECQDLEKQALEVFTIFFSNARFIMVGDIFQSIQKEPKESILWTEMSKIDKQEYDSDDYFRMFMKETPRVPRNILSEIKKCLTTYYPELTDIISGWTTANDHTEGEITWNKFNNWKEMYKKSTDFVEEHGPSNSMILTFSSAITVSGNLGDIARLRSHIRETNIPVNCNHKRMEDDKLFLSTANSSKGLERDHVLVILTFPLEKAFMCFSSDLVMNLITVALSRAKKSVTIFVPATKDKASIVMNYYDNNPIEADKVQEEFKFGPIMERGVSVTEMIKLGVIKYQSRMDIKNFAKPFLSEKITNNDLQSLVPKLYTDEERCLVGILVEHLITTTWAGKWPGIKDVQEMEGDPNFSHCLGRVKGFLNEYMKFIRSKPYKTSNTKDVFDAMYLYSRIVIAINHKTFISIPKSEIEGKLFNYWKTLEGVVRGMKPENMKLDVQAFCKMPFVTGVIDMKVSQEKGKYKNESETFDEQTIWEIKASTARDWEDDALTQALSYALMTGKKYSKIILINPFKNIIKHFSFRPNQINTVRHIIYNDCAIYNGSSYLCKNIKNEKITDNQKRIEMKSGKCMFIGADVDNDGKIFHLTLLNLFSPTKIDKVLDIYARSDNIPEKYSNGIRKQSMESELSFEDLLKKLHDIMIEYKEYSFYTYDKNITELSQDDRIMDLFQLLKTAAPDAPFVKGQNMCEEMCQSILSYKHVDVENDRRYFFKYDFDSSLFRTVATICLANSVFTFV